MDAPTTVADTADFVLSWLIGAPWGVLEAADERGSSVAWRFKPRRSSEIHTVCAIPRVAFRPILAPLGRRFLNNPYRGQALFSASFEGDLGAIPIRFSLFLCNEAETGVWIKIYRLPTFDEQFRPNEAA